MEYKLSPTEEQQLHLALSNREPSKRDHMIIETIKRIALAQARKAGFDKAIIRHRDGDIVVTI